MGTQAYIIARHSKTNKIQGITVHWDGDSCLPILNTYYSEQEKVNKLIELGDLSSLGETLAPDPENLDLTSCEAYHRDHAEQLEIQTFEYAPASFLAKSFDEYAYFFCPKKGRWMAFFNGIPDLGWNGDLNQSDFANIDFEPTLNLNEYITAVNSIVDFGHINLVNKYIDPSRTLSKPDKAPLWAFNEAKDNLDKISESSPLLSKYFTKEELGVKFAELFMRFVDGTQIEKPRPTVHGREVNAEADLELPALISTYLSKKAKLEALEKEVKDYSNQIKSRFEFLDFGALPDKEKKSFEITARNGYRVTMTQTTTTSIDSKSLKEALPEVFDKYKKESTFLKMFVKQVHFEDE